MRKIQQFDRKQAAVQGRGIMTRQESYKVRGRKEHHEEEDWKRGREN